MRVEAGCLALQPMLLEDDELVGFHPPSLTSLRCDVLKKMGELENVSSFAKQSQIASGGDELVKPEAESPVQSSAEEKAKITSPPSPSTSEESKASSETPKSSTSSEAISDSAPTGSSSSSEDNDSGLDAIRDALSL